MAIKPLPITISILKLNDNRLAGLLPTLVPDTYSTDTGDYHPHGFYSSAIYGKPGTDLRMTRHSFIRLKTNVFHPKLLKDLLSLKQLYKDILSGSRYAIFDPELKDFVASDIMNGDTGFSFFAQHVKDIQFKETRSQQRSNIIKELNKYRDDIFMDKLIVLPAGLRELEKSSDGRDVEHELTKLYKKVLFQTNAISDQEAMKEDPRLDNIRWSIQRHVLTIDAFFEEWTYGKRGFYEAKWGSRRVVGSTRNVITSMVNDAKSVNDENLPDINTGFMGLFQFAKSSVPQFKFELLNRILPNLESMNHGFNLIDPKTLKPKEVRVSQKTRDYWLTLNGVEKLLNAFNDVTKRTKPIVIEDGYYIKLIYKDNEKFILMDTIDDLPVGYDEKKVSPLTWAELLYIVLVPLTKKGFYESSRYPILKQNSAYLSKLYLKSTRKTLSLREYDLNSAQYTDIEYHDYPVISDDAIFFDTYAPNPLRLNDLGGDFDGDKMQGYMAYSKESYEENVKIMNDPMSYIDTNGKLKVPITTDISDWVLANYR